MSPFAALRDAWFFYSRHLGLIIRLCLPLILLEGGARLALAHWLGHADPAIRDLLLGLLFYPLYSAALILLLDARSRGQTPGVAVLLAAALQRWLPMALLVGLSSSLVMLGASLFILPGLWLMARLAFAEFLLVQRGLAPLAALKGSFLLTRGRFLPLLSSVLMVVVPLWLVGGWAGGQLTPEEAPLASLALDAALGLGQLFATVVFFRLYMLAAPRIAGVQDEPADD